MKLAKPILVSFLAILALCLLPVAASATIPNTIITSGPTGTIASTSATFAFRAEAGSDGSDPASFQCRLDSLSAASWQACTAPISYTGLVEGPHRFEVRTKNGTGEGVGSVDPSPALATFTVAVPPQTTIDSGPSGATASSAAAFSFSSSESGTFQCRLDSSSPADWSACASPKSYAGLSQGSHTFEVRAVDAEGNIDPTPASLTFSVDTVAPQTTIDSGPSGATASSAAAFSFSSSESGTFQCRLDSSSPTAWAACASLTSLAGLSEGEHSFEVRAVDAVGNIDPTPALASFSVDTVAPQTTIDSTPTGTIDIAAAAFSFSSSESGTFQCRLDSSSSEGWSTCASPASLSGLSEGTHTFEVRAIDAVGNVDVTPASATFSVDTVAPETTIDTSPPGTIDMAEAEFAFSSSEEGTFECRLDSVSDADWSLCISPSSLSGLSEGEHSFEVRAVDAVGNVDETPAVSTFAVDTISPKTAIEQGPEGTIDVATATIEFSSPDQTATFECRLDSSSGEDWKECTSPSSLTGLSEGEHTFEVRAVDPIGNTDPSPASVTFSVDTVAPDTAIDVAPAPKVGVTEASFVFSASGAAGFECRIDSAAEDAWAPCTSPVVLTGLADGTHTFEARAVDAVGNTDSTPAVTTFAVDIPVNGAKLAVAPLTGKVRIKTPDIKRFRPLTEGETIPVGSQVDTTEGKVRLVSANLAGEQQQASFSQGTFSVGQKAGSGLVVLKLRGKLGSCAGEDEAAASGRSGRRLWGSGKGQFRTTGSYGSATVRGTVWFTEDRCEGTYFEVTRGVVGVRDFPRHKTVAVREGESYLAQKPGS